MKYAIYFAHCFWLVIFTMRGKILILIRILILTYCFTNINGIFPINLEKKLSHYDSILKNPPILNLNQHFIHILLFVYMNTVIKKFL